MAELGCGWGCWMNNTGVAARTAGLDVHLIGVEGDEGHFAFAREACATTGSRRTQVTLSPRHRGGALGDGALSTPGAAGEQWGLEPVFGATEDERAVAVASGEFDELPTISLRRLTRRAREARPAARGHPGRRGRPGRVVPSGARRGAWPTSSSVRTHARSRDVCSRSLLGGNWRLEIERPAIVALGAAGPTTTVDGVHGWRNLSLVPV